MPDFLIGQVNSLFWILIPLLGAAMFIFAALWLAAGKKKKISPLPAKETKNELFFKISEDFEKKLGVLISREIQKSALALGKEMEKTSLTIIKDYQDAFKDARREIKQVNEDFAKAALNELARLRGTSLKTNELLTNEVVQEFSKIYQSARNTLNAKVAETEEKIEEYQKERLKEVERKIYQLLGEIAKKTIGKTIDFSTHEKLVMEALERAKKEIF